MPGKVCFRCQRRKPLFEFYRHPRMRDGTLNKCKECTKRDVKKHYDATRLERSEYERRRNQEPERKAKSMIYMRRSRELSPDKYHARNAVSSAVRDGRLTPLPCEGCGSGRVQAHHDDYAKPLAVRWLCFRCHREGEHGQVVVANADVPSFRAIRRSPF